MRNVGSLTGRHLQRTQPHANWHILSTFHLSRSNVKPNKALDPFIIQLHYGTEGPLQEAVFSLGLIPERSPQFHRWSHYNNNIKFLYQFRDWHNLTAIELWKFQLALFTFQKVTKLLGGNKTPSFPSFSCMRSSLCRVLDEVAIQEKRCSFRQEKSILYPHRPVCQLTDKGAH